MNKWIRKIKKALRDLAAAFEAPARKTAYAPVPVRPAPTIRRRG